MSEPPEATKVIIEILESSGTFSKTEEDSGTNSQLLNQEEVKNPIQSSFSNKSKIKINHEESKKPSKNRDENDKGINFNFKNSKCIALVCY